MRTSFGIFIFVQILFIVILCITCFFMICLKSSLLNGIFRQMARNRKLEGERISLYRPMYIAWAQGYTDVPFIKYFRDEWFIVRLRFKNNQRGKWYYRWKNFGPGEFCEYEEWLVLWSREILFIRFSRFLIRNWNFKSNLFDIRRRFKIHMHIICCTSYVASYIEKA